MFRRLMTGLATYFPTKAASDRLLPYVTLLAAALGAVIALIQYGNNLAIARVTATMELHKQYLSETFAKAREEFDSLEQKLAASIVRTRCNFIKAAGEKGELPAARGVTPDCNNLTDADRAKLSTIKLEGNQRQALRQLIFSAPNVAKLNEEIDATTRLGQLELFFRSIVVCVQQHNCNGETAVALFAHDMTSFVNATCSADPPLAQQDDQRHDRSVPGALGREQEYLLESRSGAAKAFRL
jgi:hypothetical protein